MFTECNNLITYWQLYYNRKQEPLRKFSSALDSFHYVPYLDQCVGNVADEKFDDNSGKDSGLLVLHPPFRLIGLTVGSTAPPLHQVTRLDGLVNLHV